MPTVSSDSFLQFIIHNLQFIIWLTRWGFTIGCCTARASVSFRMDVAWMYRLMDAWAVRMPFVFGKRFVVRFVRRAGRVSLQLFIENGAL
jgi:hypothetical protein